MPNDTSPNRSYEQLPEAVSGFDIGGNVFVPQPVSVSPSFPGSQVVRVTGAVDRIYIQPINGQFVVIDALATVKTVVVQASTANAVGVGTTASVPAGAYGFLISSQSGWFFVPTNSSLGAIINDSNIDPTASYPIDKLATYLRTVRPFTPTGVAATDTARLAAIFAAIAAGGPVIELRMSGGSALVNAPLNVADHVIWTGNRGTSRIVSSVVDVGNPTDAPVAVIDNATLGATTIAAINVIGTAILTVATNAGGALPIGTWAAHYKATPTYIRVRDDVSGNGIRGGTYQIYAVDGALNVTLTRTCKYQLGIGDEVTVRMRVPSNITIHGLTFSGTGRRLVEFEGVRNCLVDECLFDARDGAPGDAWTAFDTFGFWNQFRRSRIVGGQAGTNGFALQSQDESRITECDVEDVPLSGHVLFDSVSCVVRDCTTNGSGTGVNLTADGNILGCLDCLVAGGAFRGNTYGVAVGEGSQRSRIVGVESQKNTASNLYVGTVASIVRNTLVDGGMFGNGITLGITLTATSRATLLRGVDVSACGTFGLNIAAGADATVEGLVSIGLVPAGQSALLSAGTLFCVNSRIDATAGAAVDGIVAVTGGKADFVGGSWSGPNSSNILDIRGGTVAWSHLTVTVAGGGLGVYQTGGTAVPGPCNDFAAAAHPYASDAGVFNNPERYVFSDVGVVASAVTRYLTQNGVAQAVEASAQVRISRACVLRKLRIDFSAAPGGVLTETVTVRKNGVDTVLSVTVTGANVSGVVEESSGANYHVEFAEGDMISIKIVNAALSLAADPRVIVEGV